MQETAIASPKAPSVSDLLGVALALDDDELRDPAALRARDRALGRAFEDARVRDPARQLVAWLQARGDSATATAGRVRGALRGLAGLLTLAGFVLGWGAALGVLAFETGSGRINVVLVLALLVAVPVVMLALSVLAALPMAGASRIPGVELLVGGLRWLSTGRIAMRLVPAAQRDALAAFWGRGVGHGRLYGTAQKWLLLAVSQAAALAFGVGAVVGTLGLVVFTDLAFGWSTTLEIASADFHRVVWWLARPWSALWVDAVPTAELVEATRFFRVDPTVPEAIDPGFYGRWWPFVLAAIGTYAVFPRALWAGFCVWRLHRSVRVALFQTPGVGELLDRMQSPLIEMGQEGAGLAAEADEPGAVDWASERRPPGCIISWAESADAASVSRIFGAETPAPLRAGGNSSLDDDRAAIAAAATASGDVAVVVRGYEPPVAELLDFFRDLRTSLGDGRGIDVVPLGAAETDLRVWAGALARGGDPWLRAVRPPDGSS